MKKGSVGNTTSVCNNRPTNQTKLNLVLPDILCSYHGYHLTLLRVCQLTIIKQHTGGHGEKAEVRYGHRYLTEWSEMVNGQKKESDNWNADL